MKRAFVGVFLLLGAASAHAETIDLNLSGDALNASFYGPLSNLFPRVGGLYQLGLLNGERAGTNYFEGEGELLVTGDAGAERANVTAGLGVRLAALDVEQITGEALALGGQVEARLPAFNRIGAVGSIWGAPDASSFGDITGYLEYAIDADYQVLRNASLYLGYRQLVLHADTFGTVTVDNGWHVGLRLNF